VLVASPPKPQRTSPDPIVLHWLEQGTPEWLARREGLYTGSGADKLLMFAGQLKVVRGVVSKYSIAEITGFGGNYHTKRGHLLEDKAIELYCLIRKCTVEFPGFVTNTKYPGCGYSPDGWMPERLLEVKCFERKKHLDMYHGNIPFKVLAQIHFGLFLTNRPECDLIIYNPEFAMKEIDGVPNPDYDPKLAFKIINIKRKGSICQNFRRVLKVATI